MRVIGGHRTNNPDHWRNHFHDCPIIKLDGQTVSGVSEADDVAGFVVVVVYENGKAKLDHTGQCILTERRCGKVEIIGPAIGAKS